MFINQVKEVTGIPRDLPAPYDRAFRPERFVSSLVDLVEYLEEMPVEERTRSMLVYIEMAMGDFILSGYKLQIGSPS